MTTLRIIGFTLLVIVFQGGNAIAQTNFLETRAAQAFQAENFEVALEEFVKLAQANPDNPLVLRYLAITQRMLGQYDQSIKTFQQAVSLAPGNPATHYHLGVTYYLSQQFNLANEAFQHVIELSPQSEYTKLGQQYLAAIRDELELIAKRQEVSLWSLYAQAGMSYDDNVSAFPDVPEFSNINMGSGSGNGYLSLRGYFLRDYEQWLGTAELSGYLIGYFEDDFEALDTGTYSGSITLQNTGQLVQLPYIAEAKYLYQHVDIDRDVTYSNSNIALISGKLFWHNNYSAKLTYTFSDDDFSYEGPAPEFTSRDGQENKLSITGSWFTEDGLKNIDIGASYHSTDAKGLNFDVDGFRLFVEGEVPLVWDVRGALKLSYGEDDYYNFSGPIKRETEIYLLELRLTRWFGKRLFLSADFGYRDELSNYDALSYDRFLAGVTLGFSY